MDSDPEFPFLQPTASADLELEDKLKMNRRSERMKPLDVEAYESEIREKLKVKDLRSLSSGSFGKVFLSKDLDNEKTLYAIKVITCRYAEKDYRKIFIKRAKSEVYFLQNLAHDHIISTKGEMWVKVEDEEQPSHVLIKTEFLDTDLWDRIMKVPLFSDELTRLITEIGSSIEYMHARQCIHNDIKPENIGMIGEDKVFKIFDFGYTKLQPKSRDQRPLESEFFCGTPAYRSPKKRSRLPYDPYKADVYAFVITIVQCALSMDTFDSIEQMYEDQEYYYRDIIRDHLDLMFNIEQIDMLCRMAGPEEDCPRMSEVLSVFT